MASAQISETIRPAYLWSGSEWIPIGDGGGGGGGEIFYQSASPSAPAIGTLWVDEDGSVEDDIAGISHDHDLTYLSLNTASNTYLTINNASSTYATIVDLNNIDLTSTINTASAAAYASASAYTNSASSSLVSYTNTQVSSGINTASAAAVNFLIDSAPGTLDTLNELSAALNDDPNFYSTIQSVYLTQSNASATYLTQSGATSTYLTQSNASATYSPISNPTFTGTSLFENAQISGILDVQEIREKITEVSIVSGSATANFNDGGLFYIATAASANFTLNITNIPNVNLRSQTISVVLTQGATGYIPNVFMIDGVSQTIRWLGGSAPTPTSSAGKIDIFNFTVFRTSSSTLIIANSNLNI